MKRNLIVASISQVNNYIFYCIKNGTGLYRYDIETGKNKKVGCFKSEGNNGVELYKFSFVWNNLIFFIPNKAMEVAIYDSQKEKLFYDATYNQMVDYLRNKEPVMIDICRVRQIGECVYATGCWSDPYIYKMNIPEKKGYKLDIIEEKIVRNNIRVSIESCFWSGEKCIFPAYEKNFIYEVNVVTEQMTERKISDSISCAHSVAIVKDREFILENNGFNLLELGADMKKNKVIYEGEHERVTNKYLYYIIQEIDNKLYLIPQIEGEVPILIYDIDMDKMEQVRDEWKGKIRWLAKWKNKLIMFLIDKNKILILEDDRIISNFSFEMDDDTVLPYYPKDIVKETDLWSLDYLLNYIGTK